MRRQSFIAIITLCSAGILFAQGIRLSHAEGRYGEAIRLVGLGPEGTELRYRFEGGSWMAMGRAIDLDAFPGEERRYRLSFEALDVNGSVLEQRSAEYLIDRMPPAAASIRPAGGAFEGKVKIEISGEAGARLHWAITRGDSSEPLFVEGDLVSVELAAPERGVAYYRVYAFMKDEAGNVSPLSEALFAVYSEGIAPPSVEKDTGIEASGALDPPEIVSVDEVEGGMRVTIRASRLFVALQEAGKPSPSAERYVAWPVKDGLASVEVKAPSGYSGEFDLYASASPLGVVNPSRAFRFKLANTPKATHEIEAPEIEIRYASGAGGIIVAFGMARKGSVRYQVGAESARPYEGPFGLKLFDAPSKLSWWVEHDGARGPARSIELPRAPALSLPVVLGLPEGGVTNRDVSLRVEDFEGLRYELSGDGSAPSPVGPGSKPFPGTLSFDAPEGQDIAFKLRLRRFPEGSVFPASDEIELDFRIDKAPPPPPSIIGIAERATYDSPRPVSLESKGATAYYRVLRAGETEPEFRPYDAPFMIGRGDEERSLYRVEAYAIDAAGNRSLDIALASCTIDSASLYVSAKGSDANPGSVDRPLASLEKAISLAQIQGRRYICVQGSASLGVQARVTRDISIIGGYDADWAPAPDARASIQLGSKAGFMIEGAALSLKQLDFAVQGSESSLLQQSGGTLSVSSCSFLLEKPLAPRALSASSTACSFTDSSIIVTGTQRDHVALFLSGCRDARTRNLTISVAGKGEAGAIMLNESRFTGEGLELSVDSSARAMVARAASSELTIEASSLVSGAGNSLALGLSASDSIVELTGVRFSIGATEGATALSAEGGRLSLSRCSVASEGLGPRAFFYGFLVSSANLRIASSIIDIGASSAPVALSAARSVVEIRHMSLVMRGRGAQALSFDAGSLELSNSALYCFDGTGAGILSLGSSSSFTIDAGRNAAWGFSAIATGRDPGLTKAASDALGARLVSEVPAKTFSGSAKEPYSLKAGSALIGAGAVLDSWPLEDFSGVPWGRQSDIGAQAYRPR